MTDESDERELTCTAPTIHIGGTSKDILLGAYQQAFDKMNEAIKALHQTDPAVRDYPEGSWSFDRAFREHSERLMRLKCVRDELMEIYRAISDQ